MQNKKQTVQPQEQKNTKIAFLTKIRDQKIENLRNRKNLSLMIINSLTKGEVIKCLILTSTKK